VKIAIDFRGNFGYSGISTYNKELTKSLVKTSEHHTFCLVTVFKKAAVLQLFFGLNAHMIYEQFFPHLLSLGPQLKGFVRWIHSRIWKIISHKYDLIHFTDPNLFDVNVKNGVVTFHDLIQIYDDTYNNVDQESRLTKTYRDVIAHAKMIFVPTYFVKAELKKYFRFNDSKVLVTGEGAKLIYHPIDVDWSKLETYGIGLYEQFFLYVGRIDKRKNLYRMLDAFSKVQNQGTSLSKIVMISMGSSKRKNELNDIIHKLGLEKKVIHLQNVTDQDLVHFYNAAMAMILVSLSEGFGLPVLEAMQCGCPVITSNTTSLAEVAGKAALTVNPENTEEIRAAMTKLLLNSTLREDLRQKGFEQAKQYSWKKTAYLTLEGYKKALTE